MGDIMPLPQRDVPGGVGVQVPGGGVARLELIKTLTADHGGVVPAVAKLGEEKPVPAGGAGGLKVGPDAAVGGYPTLAFGRRP